MNIDMISNAEAADFLMQNIFNPNKYQPEINMAAMKGAFALLLVNDADIEEFCYQFMDDLYSAQWAVREQDIQAQDEKT